MVWEDRGTMGASISSTLFLKLDGVFTLCFDGSKIFQNLKKDAQTTSNILSNFEEKDKL